jgi:hypothetical protein
VALPGRLDRQLADIDGDGQVDILARDEVSSALLFGAGDGTFRSGPAVELGKDPLSLAALGDFDLDGAAEIVAFVDIPQPLEGGAGDFMRVFAGPDGLGDFTGTYAPADGFAIATGVIAAHGHPSALWIASDDYAFVVTPGDERGYPAGGMILSADDADVGVRRLPGGVGGEFVLMGRLAGGTLLTFVGEDTNGQLVISGRVALPVMVHANAAFDLDADLGDELVLAGESVVILRTGEGVPDPGCFERLDLGAANDVALADVDGDGAVELLLARPPGFEVHALGV